jgi:hypothetical protein
VFVIEGSFEERVGVDGLGTIDLGLGAAEGSLSGALVS